MLTIHFFIKYYRHVSNLVFSVLCKTYTRYNYNNQFEKSKHLIIKNKQIIVWVRWFVLRINYAKLRLIKKCVHKIKYFTFEILLFIQKLLNPSCWIKFQSTSKISGQNTGNEVFMQRLEFISVKMYLNNQLHN